MIARKPLFIRLFAVFTALTASTPAPTQTNTGEESYWQEKRVEVRKTLFNLLGDIPPRPEKLNVKTVSREERNGYVLDKFMIDNEFDSWIPGYLAIPSGIKGKVPVIIGMHGHGSIKDNIFVRIREPHRMSWRCLFRTDMPLWRLTAILEEKLDQIYSLYKMESNFRSIVYKNTGHIYTDDMKIEMIRCFDKHLKNQ